MAVTNFAALTNEELTAWSLNFMRHERNKEFLTPYTGEGDTAMIQKITELRQDQKGARAVMTLVQESAGDGVAGDRQLEGNEEAMTSDDIVIRIDQLRHAHVSKGRMAEQRSVVRFRREALSNLAYWLADRRSQMAMLSLAGIGYTFNLDGTTRTGSDLVNLDFSADVTAPSTNRYGRWDASTGLEFGSGASNNDLVAADTLTWAALVDLKAQANWYNLKPVMVKMADGEEIEVYHVFVDSFSMANLKKDTDFKANLQYAGPRTNDNPLFRGARRVFVDGLVITETDYAFTTKNATSGSAKWGAGNDVDGGRVVLAGAQALGFADIGKALWVEKEFDYENRPGISVGKIFGFKKPVYLDPKTNTEEDFGVICMDVAL